VRPKASVSMAIKSVFFSVPPGTEQETFASVNTLHTLAAPSIVWYTP
jgi:hypothetical protein